MRTKNEIKNRVKLMLNLSNLVRQMGDSLAEDIAPEGDDCLYGLLNRIETHEFVDLDEIMFILEDEGYLNDVDTTKDDAEEVAPEITIDQLNYITVSTPVDGGRLVVHTGSSDFGTRQVGIMYNYEDCEIDLALAEVKRGELAEISGKPSNNRDVDLYIYSNAYSDDWESRYTVEYDDIVNSFADE